MKKVQLGSSDLQVSEMGFGHCDFGTKISKEQAFKVLDAYYEAGGNFIDTSNNYALWLPGGRGGESEEVIGEWMSSRGNRDKIILATKVGSNIVDLESVKNSDGSFKSDWFMHGEGLSKSAINNAVEGSLSRLQTDYIDLYYAHVEDDSVDLLETLEAFTALHKKGVIRAIGCSNHSAWKIERAKQLSRENNLISYCCTQDLHSYLKPLPSKREHFATVEKLGYVKDNKDISLVAYTPTIWGKYSRMHSEHGKEFWGEFYTSETESRLAALSRVAKIHNTTEIQIVYAWMMQTTPAAIPLIATGSVEHLKQNIAAAEIVLNSDEMELLHNPEK